MYTLNGGRYNYTPYMEAAWDTERGTVISIGQLKPILPQGVVTRAGFEGWLKCVNRSRVSTKLA